LRLAALAEIDRLESLPTDPFVPDWSVAPEWAELHTVDEDGTGTWWSIVGGIVLGDGAWYQDLGEGVPYRTMDYGPRFDLAGLDWRNSLRVRPK